MMNILDACFPLDLGKGLAITEESVAAYNHHTENVICDGFFPLGANTTWHSGIHLYAKKDQMVHACANGRIVAVHLSDTKGMAYYGNTNFILLEHRFPGKESKEVWYSMYYHLKDETLDGTSLLLNEEKIPWLGKPQKQKTEPGEEAEKIKMLDLREGVIKVDIPVRAGEPLWLVGEKLRRTSDKPIRRNLLHWEIFSEKKFFEKMKEKEDTDQDWSMDVNEFLGFADQDGDQHLSRDEILSFYRSHQPKDQASKKELREHSYRFINEGALAVEAIFNKFANLKFNVSQKEHLRKSIAPYLWWKMVEEKEVALPSDPVVYHYNPGYFVQKLYQSILHFGIFFDGTNNDLEGSSWGEDQAWNVMTNIGKLFFAYEKIPRKSIGIYRNGLGTGGWFESMTLDKLLYFDMFKEIIPVGGATGAFGHERISLAISDLEIGIFKYMQRHGEAPIEVVIDVFGFSRGAALARHFVNVIHKKAFQMIPTLEEIEFTEGPSFKDRFRINFLGVFDTVSSFGKADNNDDDTNLWDDGYFFHIDQEKVDFCYHLRAEDEKRSNFPCQSIQKDAETPLSTGNIIEETAIGAHADVGGGYPPENELDQTNDLARIYLDKMHGKARSLGVPLLTYEELLEEKEKEKKLKEEDQIYTPLSLIWNPKADSTAKKWYEEVMEYYRNNEGLQTEHWQLRAYQGYWKHLKAEGSLKYHRSIEPSKTGRSKEVDIEGRWKEWKREEERLAKIEEETENKITTQTQLIKDQLEEGSAFLKTYSQLEKFHIHTSHWPVNTLIAGMRPRLEVEKNQLIREIYYNEEKGTDISMEAVRSTELGKINREKIKKEKRDNKN